MSLAFGRPDERATVSTDTIAFLADLARLPEVQQGDLDAVALIICERALRLVEARYVSVWMLNPERTHLRSIVRLDSATGKRCPDTELPIDNIRDELAALQLATHIVSDNAMDDHRLTGVHDGYLRQFGITSLLEHVIRVSGTDVGLLSFERTGAASPWQPADLALARGLCSYLALTAVNRQKLALERKSAQTAALQSAILENVAYAVIATDLNGTITFFNRAAEQMLGYRSAEIVNRTTPAIFHDPIEVQVRAARLSVDLHQAHQPGFSVFTAKTLAGESNEEEWTYIHRDGRRFTVLLSITAIRDQSGNISGFLGIASDVTERNRVSSRLRQSEEMLSRVLLQSPDAILITALSDGRILELNPGFIQITGYTRAEAMGRTTIDLDVWADINERNAMLKQVRENGEVKSMPVQIKRRGANIRQCVLWGRTFEYNGVDALLTSVHDVTDIKEAEQSAKNSQRMLRSVLDAIPSRVYWKDRHSTYVGCNAQFAQAAGLRDTAAVLGKTDLDPDWYRGPQDRLNDEMDRRVMATKQAEVSVRQSYLGANGVQSWIDVSKVPLLDDADNVTGILGVQHDITDQLLSEEQLRASEEKLRSLFALSPLGINLQSMDGRDIEANDAFLAIVGYDRDEITKKTCYDLISAEFLGDEPARLQRLKETGLIPAYEKAYYRKDGSLVPVSTVTVLVSGPDGQEFKWTIVEDITIRRQAEAAQRRLNDDLERLVAERTAELQTAMEGLMRAEKLASLGSLVAGVAHEISTPVGNASLATSTLVGAIQEFEPQVNGKLSRTALDGFVRQVKLGVDIANRNIERVANLIQSFKQVAVDQTSSQRRQFQLTEVVDEILTTMHPSLKRAAVHPEVSVAPDLVLDSYPGPLGQVLTNLINNALVHAFSKDAADKTSSRRISIKARAIDGQALQLDVADNGAGMAATVLGRIFDPFFTSKLGQGGSGLGLHIVHNIVTDVLAGSIAVESELGRGTTFSIVIPRVTPIATIAPDQGKRA
ncbi:PAS domain S-box protein [Dongia sp.]|uniref:PAS domain S-box protein n=1 Tax=Dongia sp. TaxID=1977262 RepID=UPI0035AF9539